MRTINRSLAASLFNVFARIVLVVIASGVMVRLIRTDPDSAATFAPVYFLVLAKARTRIQPEADGQHQRAGGKKAL